LAEAWVQRHRLLEWRLLYLLDLLDFLNLLHRILWYLNGQTRAVLLLLLQHLDPFQLLLELRSLEVHVLLQYFLVLVNLVHDVLLVFYLLLRRLILWLPVVVWDLVHAHGSVADSHSVITQETFVGIEAWFAVLLPATVRGESSDMAHFWRSNPLHGGSIGNHGLSIGASGSHGLLVDAAFSPTVLA
jgi:hypothetical protein